MGSFAVTKTQTALQTKCGVTVKALLKKILKNDVMFKTVQRFLYKKSKLVKKFEIPSINEIENFLSSAVIFHFSFRGCTF